MTDLQKEMNRLSNLRQNKKKDKSIIERMAQINVWNRQIDIKSKFAKEPEKILAESLFKNYLDSYQITTYNEVQNVSDLVYEEVLKHKIQIQIDKIVNDDKSNFIPDKLISSMHDVEDRIWKLKEKAGIVAQKEKNDLTALEEYEKKLDIYIAFHRNEFTFWSPVVCKECGNKNVEPILLRKKVKDFEALKHPFFSGRFYYNRRGMELVKAEIWNKEQYAWVFQTSVAFVDWCLENENKIVEIDGVEEKEIQEFINSRSYLTKPKISENIFKDKR